MSVRRDLTRRTRRCGSLLWRAVVFEVNIYRSLLRWILRRPAVGPADEPIGYAQLVTPVLSLWIFASAVEIPIVHLLLPWRTAQLVALVLSLWGLVWMLGLLAGLRVYPHLMSPECLRLRGGPSVDIRVPWSAIRSATVRPADLPSSIRTVQPIDTEGGLDLRVGVSGQVNIQLQMQVPLAICVHRRSYTVTHVSFWADEPRAVVGRIRERLAAGASAVEG